MSSVRRLASTELPSLVQQPLDLLVCCASFEARCLTAPSTFAGLRREEIPKNVLVAFNTDYESHVAVNRDAICEMFPSTTRCPLRTDDPISSVDSLVKCLSACWPPERPITALVDISTFTRESLLILLQHLWSRASSEDRIWLSYSSAEEYHVGSAKRKWLSQGIREVRSVLGFPGDLRPSRSTHLVVMAGFERDRAVGLITECEPSRVSLGIADPSDYSARKHESSNRIIVDEIRNLVGCPVDEFLFSGYDPFKAAVSLREQVRVVADANTIIAPMNTKISTVGAAIAASQDSNIQLCYAEADIYNYDAYSEPSGTVFSFALPPLSIS